MEKKVEFLKDHGFRIGDVVKITRKCPSGEGGWRNSWASPTMDKYIGQTFTVVSGNSCGISLNKTPYGWPWQVLQIVGRDNAYLHRVLWEEMAKLDRPHIREKAVITEKMGFSNINCECFACEEALKRQAANKRPQRGKCSFCPINWTDNVLTPGEIPCEAADSPYFAFKRAANDAHAQKLAKVIADLPWGISEVEEEDAPKAQKAEPAPPNFTITIDRSKYTLLRPLNPFELKSAGACTGEWELWTHAEYVHNASCEICSRHFDKTMRRLIKERRLSWLTWLLENGFILQEKVTTPFAVGDAVVCVPSDYAPGFNTKSYHGNVYTVKSCDGGDWYKLEALHVKDAKDTGAGYIWNGRDLEKWDPGMGIPAQKYDAPKVDTTSTPIRDGHAWTPSEKENLKSAFQTLCEGTAKLNDRKASAIAWRICKLARDLYGVDLSAVR